MSSRDDFRSYTKKRLAERVAYHCSFPGCGAITVGPSENPESSCSSGMACHIAAASEGGKRYLPGMSVKERQGIGNGIWMCFTHGKLIDTDETRFTIEKLKSWKARSERIAEIMLTKGKGYDEAIKLDKSLKLSPDEVVITNCETINDNIGNAVTDSCIAFRWGNNAELAIRDFLIEYAINSFSHGGANNVKIHIKDNRIVISDNGGRFDIQKLQGSNIKSGGTIAIKSLFNTIGERMIYTYERIQSSNIITIGFIEHPNEIATVTPCNIILNLKEIKKDNRVQISVRESCNEIYIVLPKFLCISDVRVLSKNNLGLEYETRRLVFIADNLSERVIDLIDEYYPGSKIITL